MKVVIQRVKEASCTVEGQVISKIQKGLVLLVGFTHTDTEETVEYIAKKIANMRIFEDENLKMNQSVIDVKGSILSISQFTIYGDPSKGNRPSFTEAMKPDKANELYLKLSNILNETYQVPTRNGIFGAMMDIQLINDGPVTIILSRE